MSTPDSTSSLPPSKPRVLTPDEADRIADSIRPSWEAPPPSARLTPPMAATAPGTARVDADRTLTNNELRALERSKRLRAVPENSYREERSPSAPPDRVEKASSEASIIVDPRALAAPRLPSALKRATPLPTTPAAAVLSADSTVVIAPPPVSGHRPQRLGLLVGFGAVAALVAGAIYFVSAQPGAAVPAGPAGPAALQLNQTPAAAAPPPVEAPPPVVTPPPNKPEAELVAKAEVPKPEATKSHDPPKRARIWGATPKPDPVVAQTPPPKPAPKPAPAVGGEKGKLVRDLPF